MTLLPASGNRSSILSLTSWDAPQPQSSPKVMVPSATSESRTPDLPKSLYLTRFPHFLWTGCVQESTASVDVRVPVDRATARVCLDWPPGSTLNLVDMKREVREFLTSRRARITPEQAGLRSYGRRRVPGLRREEVAVLAGVSVPYYTRLERGEMSGVSQSVLEALARALGLDEAERAHLFDLARAAQPAPAIPRRRRQPKQPVRPEVQDRKS